MKTNKGFTLIELLVVVLIIGILAAIALPMYTKSVEKARFTEAQVMTKTILDAMNRYIEANGSNFPKVHQKNLIDVLDIELAGGAYGEYGSYYTKNYYYSMESHDDNFFLEVGRISTGGLTPYYFQYEIYPSVEQAQNNSSWREGAGNIVRYADCGGSVGRMICKPLEEQGYNVSLW